jgi:hypothetical protein
MTDPFQGEFNDILDALSGTEVPMPATLERAVHAALAAPAPPERVDDLEAAMWRDADEAWSLALAFLGDEQAAWDSVVTGFLKLGRGSCAGISVADSVRAQAESALEVGRLLAKGGAAPEVCGASLAPEVRMGILLRAGLRRGEIELEGLPELSLALSTAYPRADHEHGELCRLLAREVLETLTPEQASKLEELRRAHPTIATLVRERYAEVAEVPLAVMPRVDELVTCVLEQLAREEQQRGRVGAVQLRITVGCSFCHDGLEQAEAVFCAGCLAPHHEECFTAHGRCSAPGCGQQSVVRPRVPAVVQRRPWLRSALLFGGLVAAGAALNAAAVVAAAWKANEVSFGAVALDSDEVSRPSPAPEPGVGEAQPLSPGVAPDPAVLRAAEERAARADAERAAAQARAEALSHALDSQEISVNFDETPFEDCVDFMRQITGLNYALTAEAQDVIDGECVTVSLRLTNVSAKNALHLILASHDSLGYRLDEGLVLILADTDRWAQELILEVYDVGDIVSGRTRAQGGFQMEPDYLIGVLERLLEEHEEGSVEISGETLILRKAAAAHQRTRALLAYLRGQRRVEPERPAWVEDIEARLDAPIDLLFQDNTLSEVVGFLQDVTSVNIAVSGDVDPEDITISLRLRNIPTRDALQIILDQADLGRRYRNETLVICTRDMARGALYLRILDTSDLELWLEPDQLVELVMNAVGVDTWDDPAWIGGHHRQLIVNQTGSVHEAIDDVLAKLRVSRARSLEEDGGR